MDNINKIYSLSDERVLDNLPKVDSFFGWTDLRTGSLIISAICVLHPMVYGYTCFIPMSYLLFTIWIMLAMFFAFSVLLFVGLINNESLLIDLWIWFTMVFIVIMLMLLFLLALHFIAISQKAKILVVILGILWYILTVYFILVVNSHHKAVIYASPDSPENKDVAGGDSGDKIGDSGNKTGNSDDKRGDSGNKSGNLDDKSGDADDKSGDAGDKSGDADNKSVDADDKSGDADNKSVDADDKSGNADNKSVDADDKTGDADDKSGDADRRSGDTRRGEGRAIKSSRKDDRTTKNQVWFRRKERAQSTDGRALPELDCTSLAPGERSTRGQGLSPRSHIAQEGNKPKT